MVRTMLAGAAGLVLSGTAQAAEVYMWGGGVHLGSQIIPLAYPVAFPKEITKPDFDDDGEVDTDSNGDPLTTTIERARFDMLLGGQALVNLDEHNRAGVMFSLDFAKGHSAQNFLLRYDRIVSEGTIDPFFGGAIGLGGMSFRGEGEEKLKVPHFPLRVHGGLQFRNKTQAYALTLFAQLNVPGRHLYTTTTGQEIENVGTVVSLANYPQIGLEFSALFGDFTPPKDKPPKGKKGKGDSKGGGGKGGGGKGGKG